MNEHLSIFLAGSPPKNRHGIHRPDKIGILLAAFGTSIPEAGIAFDNIGRQVRNTFPEVPVRWAHTSPTIRKKWASRGTVLDSLPLALARMLEEGFTHVAVQPLYTIRGKEYDDLLQTVRAFMSIPKGFRKIVVGAPLLSSQKDIETVAAALLENIPPERTETEAVLHMGHGTPHPANAFYGALMHHLQEHDELVYLGTVEGPPGIDDIANRLKARNVAKAWLFPFMSVAGEHARHDLGGEGEDSWRSVLKAAGIESEVVLKGTAEYPNLTVIWVGHLEEVMAELRE